MRVALPSDLGCLQNSSVSQLNQNLLPVKLIGLAIVVWLYTAHKVRLPCHHLGQQVHQRVLEKVHEEFIFLSSLGLCNKVGNKRNTENVLDILNQI